jgi:hypothetical protein
MWRDLDDAAKEVYNKHAEDDKMRHQKETEIWQNYLQTNP